MNWQETALRYLIDHPICGYQTGATPSAEATALAAVALDAYAEPTAAEHARHWLAQQQLSDGSVGVGPSQDTPGWPTGLAVLAWLRHHARYRDAIGRGVAWIVQSQGTTPPPCDEVGHDPSIPGWSWVENTHGWVEPTAFQILALTHTGNAHHPRVRDGHRLLLNRLLPAGGCNYGNTVVLGQVLRPHLLPTGWALLALRNHTNDPLVRRTLRYATAASNPETPLMSLAAALLGLAAHERFPPAARGWLGPALQRSLAFRESPLRYALALLADLGTASPLAVPPSEPAA